MRGSRSATLGLLSVLVVLLVVSPLGLWITSPGDAAVAAPSGVQQVDVPVGQLGKPVATPDDEAKSNAVRHEVRAGDRGASTPRSVQGTVVDELNRAIAGATVFLAHPPYEPGPPGDKD